jgi:hypothetical protein
MAPKEKAFKLVIDKYYNLNCISTIDDAKQCALIAVNELIEFTYNYTDYNEKSTKEYWEEVKHEIELL